MQFLGMGVHREENGDFKIHQTSYTMELLERHKIETKTLAIWVWRFECLKNLRVRSLLTLWRRLRVLPVNSSGLQEKQDQTSRAQSRRWLRTPPRSRSGWRSDLNDTVDAGLVYGKRKHTTKPPWHHHYNGSCNSLNALPPRKPTPKPPWHHHYIAICNSLHALPQSTAPQTYHPNPPWHHYNAICNSLNALPPSTAPQTPSHLDTTMITRFATLWMPFPLAQRHKPTTASHLDMMRFATLWMQFPLARRRKPTTQSHLIDHHFNIIQFATLWIDFPVAPRRKITTQRHLDTTVPMPFATLGTRPCKPSWIART